MSRSPDPSGALQSLVTHFVASRRALASTKHIVRANEIVSTSRTHLESIAAARMRNAALRSKIDQANITLHAILEGAHVVADDCQQEFADLLEAVDAAGANVTNALSQLSATEVELTLQSAGAILTSSAGEAANTVPRKSLHDFIDVAGTHALHEQVKECIDHVAEARGDHSDAIATFAAEVGSVEDELTTAGGGQQAWTPADQQGVPSTYAQVAANFRHLENHATEMAGLLQSLVRHYDLCLTALKHTEGGGKAVEQAVVEMPQGIDVNEIEEHAAQPVTEEERVEIIGIVEHDASEVEDVVQEISDRVEDMESCFDGICGENQRLDVEHSTHLKAVGKLRLLKEKVPSVIESSALFISRWRELRGRLEEKIEELESLQAFYTGFLRAYDGLLVEIGRRKAVRIQMKEIARKATARIHKMSQEDAEDREAFRLDHGEYLPSDIWAGLTLEPAEVTLTSLGEDDNDLPEISDEVLQAARKRLSRQA